MDEGLNLHISLMKVLLESYFSVSVQSGQQIIQYVASILNPILERIRSPSLSHLTLGHAEVHRHSLLDAKPKQVPLVFYGYEIPEHSRELNSLENF